MQPSRQKHIPFEQNRIRLWSLQYFYKSFLVIVLIWLIIGIVIGILTNILVSSALLNYLYIHLILLGLLALWIYYNMHKKKYIAGIVCITRQWPGLPNQPKILNENKQRNTNLTCQEAVMTFSSKNFKETVLQQLPSGKYITVTHEALKDTIRQSFPEQFSAKKLGRISLAHSRQALLKHPCPELEGNAPAPKCAACPVAANAYGKTAPMNYRVRFAVPKLPKTPV